MGVDIQGLIVHPPATGEPPVRVDHRLPPGLVRLSDPEVKPTPVDGPTVVASPIAHQGRVTLLHAREKVGKSTFIGAAAANVTRGSRFLGVAVTKGDLLWIGEEAAGDVKARLNRRGANLDRVYYIWSPSPVREDPSSLQALVARIRPCWLVIDTWDHYVTAQRAAATARRVDQRLLLLDIRDLARQYDIAVTISHHNQKTARRDALGEYRGPTAIGANVDMIVSMTLGHTPRARLLTPYGRWPQQAVTVECLPDGGYRVLPPPEADHPNPRDHSLPLDDRLLLHLHQVGSDARPPARELAVDLRSGGKRYPVFKAALERLAASQLIDRDQRPGATSRQKRGYALTSAGRARAESVRERCADGRVPP